MLRRLSQVAKQRSAQLLAGLLSYGLLSGSAFAVVVYFDDYDSSATLGAGVTTPGYVGGTVNPVAGGPYVSGDGSSWSGNYYLGAGGAVSLTLNNLPAHSQATVDMIIGFLNSWDSRDGSVAPDNLDIWVDGSLLVSMTSNNASGTIQDYDGGTLFVAGGQVDGSTSFSDNLVDMTSSAPLSFAHSSSSLTLTIQPSGAGWQGWTDEGWGMDELSISVTGTTPPPPPPPTGVPEPTSLWLLGLGLGGLFYRRLRR